MQRVTNFESDTAVARVCAAAALAIVALSQAARAQYPDKNIDLIVPYGPGGGFDIYARAVAKAMENHLPKNVRVIVRNIPGAGSVNGIATMYRAAPDGYTMGIVDLPGAVAPQIMGEQLPYDLDKATWLGTVNIGVYSLVIGKKAAFSTLEAFQKPPGRAPYFATTGSNDLAMAKIAAAVLGIKAQFLTSYTGGPATHLAIIRGEADAGLGIDVAIARHLASGDLRQLVWFAKKGARGTPPGVATADDVGHPELANLEPQPRVRRAARPAAGRAHAACRCRAESAEGPRACGVGKQDELPARRRNAGAHAQALHRPAGVPHQLPASAEGIETHRAVSIGLMVRRRASAVSNHRAARDRAAPILRRRASGALPQDERPKCTIERYYFSTLLARSTTEAGVAMTVSISFCSRSPGIESVSSCSLSASAM